MLAALVVEAENFCFAVNTFARPNVANVSFALSAGIVSE